MAGLRFLPIFISLCGLGGVLNIRRAICSVASSRSGFFAMDDPNTLDGWPPFEGQLASVPFVHAIGQISLMYNFLEDPIGTIFTIYMPTKSDFAEGLYHKLNNRDRVDLLMAIIEQNEQNQEAKSALLHLIRCFDICTENRNVLAHVIVEAAHSGTGGFPLSKKARNDPRRTIKFRITVTELRQMADEMMVTFDYATRLAFWFMQRSRPDLNLAKAMGWPDPPAPAPLPNKPPKPRRLIPSQPQANREGDPLPPSPSQDSL